MAKITQEATIILDHEDVAQILTEELCRYNAFAEMKVESVTGKDGSFELYLTPVRKLEDAA
jgi:hypothetical protein